MTPNATDEQVRLESERLFHNNRYGAEHDPREHLNKYYGAISHAVKLQEEMIRTAGRGRRVLEVGCADGTFSVLELDAPGFSAEFHGIDISDDAVGKARGAAAERHYRNASFSVMNAEAMSFPDDSFDLVFGKGIIHHLDIESAYRQVSRVLVPGGKAIFLEPMGHNPVINWYRSRTPALRTPDEHPLLMADIALARTHFSKVDARYYGLATLAQVPFRDSAVAAPLTAALRGMDELLLRLPGLRRNAWFVLLTLTK
jgi:SAM-dependent methyltransferase